MLGGRGIEVSASSRTQAKPSSSTWSPSSRPNANLHRPHPLAAATHLASRHAAHFHGSSSSSSPLGSGRAQHRPSSSHGAAGLDWGGVRRRPRRHANGQRSVRLHAGSAWLGGFPTPGRPQWLVEPHKWRFMERLSAATFQSSEKVLGMACVGFLWSSSTMMVTSLLPVFMRVELGASNLSIGLLEASATGMNTVAKVCAGVVSDKVRNRGRVIAVGSVLTALVKFLFAGATNVYGLFMARSLDRMAKGIRMAPTDALLADLSPVETRSRTYGLHHSMMTLGAVCGGIWASGCMALTAENFRFTFALAAVPALLATALLDYVVDLNEDDRPAAATAAAMDGSLTAAPGAARDRGLVARSRRMAHQVKEGCGELAKDVACMPPKFWCSLAVMTVLMTARFSEAFVFLHARSVGVPVAVIPMFAIANSLIQASVAYPLGCLTDTVDRKTVLLAGFVVLGVSDVILMFGKTPSAVLTGFMFTGLHMAMTHSNMKALMSETIPAHMRGTGFAIVAIASGVSLASGNLVAGMLSDAMGSGGAFLGGLVSISFATLLGSILL